MGCGSSVQPQPDPATLKELEKEVEGLRSQNEKLRGRITINVKVLSLQAETMRIKVDQAEQVGESLSEYLHKALRDGELVRVVYGGIDVPLEQTWDSQDIEDDVGCPLSRQQLFVSAHPPDTVRLTLFRPGHCQCGVENF